MTPDFQSQPALPATLYQRIRQLLADATMVAASRGILPVSLQAAEVPLDRPRQASHGDLATNLCFVMAKAARGNPRALAEAFLPLVREVDNKGLLAGAEVAGAGFLNLRLSDAGWQASVGDVLQAGESYGQSRVGGGAAVLLEFVSANPTGPMHVGHGRGAVLGDALARILRAADYRVATEYYINNVGNQIAKLGESVWHWLRTLAPLKLTERAARLVEETLRLPEGFPEDGYRGRYIAEAAVELLADGGFADVLADPEWGDDAAWSAREPDSHGGRADDRAVSKAAWAKMLERIRDDLSLLDIRFDRWFSERELHGLDSQDPGDNLVAACCRRLQAADWAYEGEPAAVEGADADEVAAVSPGDEAQRPLVFRGTSEAMPKAFRDGKDRVILRSDGRPTYFAADIAYHDHKVGRGFDHLINILGADHHGYVPRLQGVLHALGDLRRKEGDALGDRWSGDRLEVLLVQMVALLRDGKPVPMGKRSGEFVTLREVIEEVSTGDASSGRDAVRFLFLTRKADAQLDFDLEVARRTTMDNPVYYVQYGHARLASILQKAETEHRGLRADADTSALRLPDERELCLQVAELPEVISRAARNREPHLIAYYLMETCRAFHAYYSRNKADNRVISDDVPTTQARLALVAALKQVIANGLALLGVTAPERMADLAPEADEGLTVARALPTA